MSIQVSLKSFSDIRQQFEEGATTPRAFLEDCLEVIEAREPTVQAFEFLDVEKARASADLSTKRYAAGRSISPLDGCPVGVKDIIETADMPTCFGSPAFKDNWTGRDAACVQALRAGGAVILGKTVTTEFAIGFSGKTTNPHDPERTPGGSSSGSAAAVGCGMLPLSFGTQTNGSVLRPASYNGVIGYKGTFGTLPLGGVHPVALSHDHLGLFANSVHDIWSATSEIILRVGSPSFRQIEGCGRTPINRKPRKLVRLRLSAWREVEAAHRQIFDDRIESFRSEGIEIVDSESDSRVAKLEDHLDRDVATSGKMLAYDLRWPYAGYIERHGRLIGDRLHDLVAESAKITPQQYEDLRALRRKAQEATTATLDEIGAEAFVFPAASGPAPKGFEYTGSRAYLVYWSWLGFPSFSLPLLEADGLPWGLQVASVAYRDFDLANVAAWFME